MLDGSERRGAVGGRKKARRRPQTMICNSSYFTLRVFRGIEGKCELWPIPKKEISDFYIGPSGFDNNDYVKKKQVHKPTLHHVKASWRLRIACLSLFKNVFCIKLHSPVTSP